MKPVKYIWWNPFQIHSRYEI